MVNIALFGPPGSGKGTQSNLLQEVYNVTHIAPGNIFRAEVSQGTSLGKELQTYIDQGNLVPEALTMKIIGKKITEVPSDYSLLLDGYPRSLVQAEALQQHLASLGRTLHLVLFLEVNNHEIRDRIAERGKRTHRADDQDENVLNHRLDVYQHLTLPVAQFYENQKKLVKIDGMGTIEEVHQRILKVLSPYLSQR